jgi:hypothetical protein
MIFFFIRKASSGMIWINNGPCEGLVMEPNHDVFTVNVAGPRKSKRPGKSICATAMGRIM